MNEIKTIKWTRTCKIEVKVEVSREEADFKPWDLDDLIKARSAEIILEPELDVELQKMDYIGGQTSGHYYFPHPDEPGYITVIHTWRGK